MNYLTSFLSSFQGASEEKKQLTPEQEDFINHLKSSNGVFKFLTEQRIEEILSIQTEKVEFGKVIKVANHQDKKCEFLDSRVTFRVQDVVEKNLEDGEDIEITIPCLCIENMAYEEDQGKFKYNNLSIENPFIFLSFPTFYLTLIFLFEQTNNARNSFH